MARLKKILTKDKTDQQLTLLKKDDGTLAESKKETLDILMTTHFPDCTPFSGHSRPKSQRLTLPDTDWINIHRVKEAVREFKPGKAPGPDGITGELLQNLDDENLSYLTNLIKASMALGYTPTTWREAKVIFIPKPGKGDYSVAKSFGTITLLSVVFKLIERLALWRIQETALKNIPIHKRQYAFMKGKSTDHALTAITNRIERALGLNRQESCLAVFIDVKSAFDRISHDAIIKAMKKRGIDPEIINWYEHFLNNRMIEAEQGGQSTAIKAERGTPQGGVLSAAIAWLLNFDDFLELYDSDPVKAEGFADDSTLLAVGPDVGTLFSNMQQAINKAAKWAASCGLEFSPEKTTWMLFTNKRKPKKGKLKMYGKEIQETTSTKVLGVTIDNKLLWNEHIKAKCSSAKRILMACNSSLKKKWGPKPDYCRWLYTGIIEPMLLYGCHVWIKAFDKVGCNKRLQSVKRMAMMLIAGARRGTPTAALEIIYDLPPVMLQAGERAIMTRVRLHESMNSQCTWTAEREAKIGHYEYIRKLADIECTNLDMQTPNKIWDKTYAIEIGMGKPLPHFGITAYTDGSLIDEKSGCGGVIYKEDTQYMSFSERLNDCTVYQAELRAVRAACNLLEKERGNNITFYVDNMATLMALSGVNFNQKTLEATHVCLHALGENNMVTLRWVRAHKGTPGNEAADQAAKFGAFSKRFSEKIPTAKAKVKMKVKDNMHKRWEEQWKADTQCRQSKLLLAPDRSIWRRIQHLSKQEVSTIVKTCTGHSFHKRQNYIISNQKYPTADCTEVLCTLCKSAEETPSHLVLDCPQLHTLRNEILGSHLISPPFTKWHPTAIRKLMNEPRVAELEIVPEG